VTGRQSLHREHLQISIPVQRLLPHRRLTAQGGMSKHVTQIPVMVSKIVQTLEGSVKSMAMKGR
jgi:hypothetical protein